MIIGGTLYNKGVFFLNDLDLEHEFLQEGFVELGPIEGMVHVSQTMDDFVSFSKDKVLSGKETKRSLKVSDKVATFSFWFFS